MNMPIELNNVVSMTSLEIAELTGKRHDHVMRDIKKIQTELTAPKSGVSEETYKDITGRVLPMFKLDKKHTMILVTGYSIKLRAAVIDRIEFLESQVKRLEDTQKRAAVQSANRRGVTWGDYCKTNGLPAQKLMKAVRKAGNLFRFRPDGRVEVHPAYADCFTLIKPTDRRFTNTGLNFRFNAKGLARFSADKATDRFREILIEQLGTDYEKMMLIQSKSKGSDPQAEHAL
ncbi:Phage regulatory protein Rha (Phage_pRha) [Serratia liquefaciens]|uniref:Rha family transcriptional regulator n=1 Tax=Serratia liquefaciens TaxID=614 RepID=UPI00141D6E3D|nr:Rha family transcriptional regulator [Serratia liquefaciens]CAB1217475.1 Phage regulatory protein Rha (Phage_pRha) [Serratia liquefaciens]